MKFWLARDEYKDYLRVHKEKPIRMDGIWISEGESSYFTPPFLGPTFIEGYFKSLTWESEPVEVELKVVEKDV